MGTPVMGHIRNVVIAARDNDKRKFMLHDFSFYNRVGVIAAKELVESGYFEGCALAELSAEEVFDELESRFVYGETGS